MAIEREDGTSDSQNFRCDAYYRFRWRGPWGETRTGVEPQAFFQGGMERRKSEASEQRSDKSDQKEQNWSSSRPFVDENSEIFD